VIFTPNLDFSYSDLEEFQQPKFEGYGPKPSKSVSEDTSNEVKESPDAPLVEELVSDDKIEKKTIFPTVAEIEQQEKPVKYTEMYSFDNVQANCNNHQRERVVSGNNYTRVNYNYSAKKTHPSAQRNMVPRAVLMKTGLRPLNTARPFWNTTTARTLDNGEMEITATIDGKVKIVSEASIRRHIKLEDSDDNAASIGVDVKHGGATTTVTSLDAGQGSAFTKLIKKVKKLEKTVQHDAEVQGRHKHYFEFTIDEEVYTAEKGFSTTEPVSTASASVSTDGASSAKDKGKAIMEEAETIQTKTKLQLEQERLGYEEALRLQAKIDEEERQMISRVQEEASSLNIEEWNDIQARVKADEEFAQRLQSEEEASSLNIEEWNDIQARVKADEEFAQRLQSEERQMYFEAKKARLLAELINEGKR
ncbi:hypothetical protein Tco_1116105, partial [Tanacetum coccineum]